MPPGKPFYLSALLTSLPLDFDSGIRKLRALGFTHVDLVGLAERPPEQLESLAQSGLIVSCGAIGRNLPQGCTLDVPAVTLRRAAKRDRKSTRLNSSHGSISYAVFSLKEKQGC